jgi:hypothetical protein
LAFQPFFACKTSVFWASHPVNGLRVEDDVAKVSPFAWLEAKHGFYLLELLLFNDV